MSETKVTTTFPTSERGRIDWDAFFHGRKAGDSFVILNRDRGRVSTAASHRGYHIRSTVDGDLCRMTLISDDEHCRRRMIYAINRLTTPRLKALYNGAKQAGLLT